VHALLAAAKGEPRGTRTAIRRRLKRPRVKRASLPTHSFDGNGKARMAKGRNPSQCGRGFARPRHGCSKRGSIARDPGHSRAREPRLPRRR
jgi:hypothetical protein